MAKYVELTSLIELIKSKTGISLQEYEVYLPESIAVRNRELFPFLHENCLVQETTG